MKLALSGYAGVGKSSLIKHAHKKYKNVFIFPESAREVNSTKNLFVIEDKENDFFQKSIMDNEMMKITFAHLNRIENALFDRTIIDNFVFAELFYGDNRVNFKEFEKIINEVKDTYEIDYVYDSIVLINSTRDEKYIRDVILKDEFRKSTTSPDVKEFIKKATNWEKKYIEIYNQLKLSKELIFIDHFNENNKFNDETNAILKKSFDINKN